MKSRLFVEVKRHRVALRTTMQERRQTKALRKNLELALCSPPKVVLFTMGKIRGTLRTGSHIFVLGSTTKSSAQILCFQEICCKGGTSKRYPFWLGRRRPRARVPFPADVAAAGRTFRIARAR